MSMEQEMRRLQKSRTDRLIAGVCGGLAEFFQIDAAIVRVLWVLATLVGGWGILFYIIAAIIMPTSPALVPGTGSPPRARRQSATSPVFWGVFLIGVGLILLVSHHGFPFWFHWWGFSWKGLAGVALVLGGVMLFLHRPGGDKARSDTAPSVSEELPSAAPVNGRAPSGLRRSASAKVMFGVCGGIGEYFDVDPVIIRLLFVLAAFGSIGLSAVAYILLALLVPQADLQPKPAVA